MATTSHQNDPITIIVHLKIKPEKIARTLELWNEQIADIEANEPIGNVKYTLFRNNNVENEFTVVQTCAAHRLAGAMKSKLMIWDRFKSTGVMEAWYKSPKHDEISGKVFGEGLIDGEPEARYLSKVVGTKE